MPGKWSISFDNNWHGPDKFFATKTENEEVVSVVFGRDVSEIIEEICPDYNARRDFITLVLLGLCGLVLAPFFVCLLP